MNTTHIYIYLIIFLLGFSAQSQVKTEADSNKEEMIFDIRGSVYMQDTRVPIDGVAISVNNGAYTTTNKDGKFTVKARIGDQLTVQHKDFETIFYTKRNQFNRQGHQ